MRAGWPKRWFDARAFRGLRQGLELIRKLLEVFWDTIYPRIDDDGDLELRATPLRWVGSQLDSAVRSTPLTQAGHHWYQYRESRTLPTEAEAQSDSAKQQRRNDAAAEGILTPEEFEKGLEGTSLGVSQKIFDHLTELLQDVQDFGAYCDEKFGDASPDFVPLRTSIEEVLQTARVLLVKKGGLRSQAQTEAEALPELPQAGESPEMGVGTQPFPDGSAPTAAAPRRARGGIEPVDFDDAVERTIAVSRFLRREFPFSPAPYLMLRALRWGELRASGGYPDPNSLEPPPSEVRIELKRLANEGNWNELRERAEEAAGQPCGRSWLDLQRYAVNACRYCGVDAAAQAILSELKALLADFPQMLQWTLADDTPVANAETMEWLKENSVLAAETHAPSLARQEWTPPPIVEYQASENGDGEPATPDAYQLAMEAAQSGRVEEAFTILSREIAQERTGRSRFLRKVQLAQACLATGNEEIARPILQELAEEIEARGLQAWEGPEVIAQPLALLYGSLANAGDSDEERRKLYARICRLDPARALSLRG